MNKPITKDELLEALTKHTEARGRQINDEVLNRSAEVMDREEEAYEWLASLVRQSRVDSRTDAERLRDEAHRRLGELASLAADDICRALDKQADFAAERSASYHDAGDHALGEHMASRARSLRDLSITLGKMSLLPCGCPVDIVADEGHQAGCSLVRLPDREPSPQTSLTTKPSGVANPLGPRPNPGKLRP